MTCTTSSVGSSNSLPRTRTGIAVGWQKEGSTEEHGILSVPSRQVTRQIPAHRCFKSINRKRPPRSRLCITSWLYATMLPRATQEHASKWLLGGCRVPCLKALRRPVSVFAATGECVCRPHHKFSRSLRTSKSPGDLSRRICNLGLCGNTFRRIIGWPLITSVQNVVDIIPTVIVCCSQSQGHHVHMVCTYTQEWLAHCYILTLTRPLRARCAGCAQC